MAKNYDRLGLRARTSLATPSLAAPHLRHGALERQRHLHGRGPRGATLDYLPYMWLSFTCIIVTITLAYLGRGEPCTGHRGGDSP